MTLRILSLSIVLGLFTGCGGSAPAKGDAVAKVNKAYISVGELEQKMGRMVHLPGKDFSSNEQKKKLLDELINQELLFQTAMREGILEKSERLKSEVAREYMRQRATTERHEASDSEIQAYYEQKKDQLERIRASHILVKPDKPGDPASEAAAKAKAEKLLKQVRAGADFAKMAQENSQDDSNKARGGDLFFFDRSKMVPEFSQVAFGLAKAGDVSDVVKTQFGYHIIKLTGEQRGIDFFRQSVKWQIAQEKQREKMDTLFEDLRDKASVKIYEDKLAKVTAAKQDISRPAGMAPPPPMAVPPGAAGQPAAPPGGATGAPPPHP